MVQLLNFMPHSSDPVQEATGLPMGLWIWIIVVLASATFMIWLFFFAKEPPPFTKEQEKRITEIIEQKLKEA